MSYVRAEVRVGLVEIVKITYRKSRVSVKIWRRESVASSSEVHKIFREI